MPFEKNAFIGIQIEEIRKKHIENNTEVLGFINDLNRELNRILYSLKHTDDMNRDCFLIGLFCKIIQSFNSLIILSNYGLESDSKTVLRSMMESTFNFRAIVYDENFFEKYLKSGDKQTLYLMNNIKKYPDFFGKEIKDKLNEDKIQKIEDAIEGLSRIKTFKLAKKARMKDIYLYTYNLFSLEAHGNAKAIIRNHILENEDDTISFDMMPKYGDYNFTLLTSISVILYVLDGINEYFDIDITETIDEYKVNLSKRYGKA